MGRSFRLLDFFPEASALRNIGKDELPLIEGERFRVLVLTERQRKRLAFRAPAAADGFAPTFSSHYPILRSTISMKNQVFVFRVFENNGRFPPVAN